MHWLKQTHKDKDRKSKKTCFKPKVIKNINQHHTITWYQKSQYVKFATWYPQITIFHVISINTNRTSTKCYVVPTLIYTTWYHLEYHFGYQKYSQLHLNLPLDLVLIAAGEDSFFGPKCVIDLLQFLLDFWGGVFLEWLGEPPCLI